MTGLFSVPGETLFVEVDDELRALHAAQLRRDKHGLVAVFPLNQEGQLTVDVGGPDDLVWVESAVERILFVFFRAFVLAVSLVVRMFVIMIRLFALRVFFLGFFFTSLLFLRLFWCLILGRVVGLSLLLLAHAVIILLRAHGRPIGAVAETSFLC